MTDARLIFETTTNGKPFRIIQEIEDMQYSALSDEHLLSLALRQIIKKIQEWRAENVII